MAPFDLAQGARLLVGVLLLLCTPAFAEKTRVTLVSTGDDARAEVFQASLAELLARLQLTLDVRGLTDGGAPAGEALAAVDADFTEAEAIKLTVIDDLGRTVMVRRLTRPGASPQLQAEAAAHVVQSVMEELITASRWKPPAVDPPPLAQPPLEEAPHEALAAKAPTPEPKKPAGRFGIDFAPYFNARSFLNGAPVVPGGGVAAAFALKLGRFRPTLTVLGDYHAPFSHGDAQISLKIETVSLRALATLDVLGGDAFRIDVALGGGADLFSSAPSSGQLPQSRLGGHRTDADPVLTAAVLGHLAIFASVDIFLGVTVDFDTWPVRYVARTPLGPEKLYQPYFIRPAVMLGFTFNSLGPDPYSPGGS